MPAKPPTLPHPVSSTPRLLRATQLAAFSLALLIAPWATFAQDGAAQDDAEREAIVQTPDGVTFDVKLGGGGGRVTGTAGDFQLEEDRFLLASGGVILEYQDMRLEADRLRVDLPANTVTAEGNVLLDEGPRRMEAQLLEWDLTTRTGRGTQAKAFVSPDYYFSGNEIRKTGDMTFTIDDGVFTTCEGEVPSWSIALSKASITIDEYARIRNARVRFKRLPVLYVPYLLWPATTDRASGWLVPKPGYSNRKGAHISLAYYKTLGRSADTTFNFDLSTEEYLGIGNETRYRPTENTNGILQFYYATEPDDAYTKGLQGDVTAPPILDPDLTYGVDDRWKVVWHHESKNIWGGWRGVVNLEEYSDFDYLKDIERSVEKQTRSFNYSNAYLTRSLGPHYWNLMIDNRETLIGNLGTALENRYTLIGRQLPEAEYKLRETQIGNLPIYFQLDGNLHYFHVDRTLSRAEEVAIENGEMIDVPSAVEYGRADLAPILSFPLSTLPWLSAKVDLGYRVSYYTGSLVDDPAGEGSIADDSETLTRAFETISAEIIGPSFSRIFDSGDDGRFGKFKHIVEPRITYTNVGDFEEEKDRILIFDEIDRFQAQEGVVFSLVNRLLAKPSDEDEGGAFEIASLEISQGLVLDDKDGTQFGQRNAFGDQVDETAIFTKLRVNPSADTSFKIEATYDTQEGAIEATKITGGTQIGRHGFGVSWFTNWRQEIATLPTDDAPGVVDFVKSRDQLRLFTSLALGRRLTFDAEVSLDLEADTAAGEQDVLTQRYILEWQADCYNWLLEYRETHFAGVEDRDLVFLLDLKNVGTFLDVNDSLN